MIKYIKISCSIVIFFCSASLFLIYILNNYMGSSNIKASWNIFNNSIKDLDETQYLFIEKNLNPKYIDDNNQKKFQKIVGIDFGSANSGFSYSLDNNINNIISNKKGPTEIILSKGDQISIINSNSAPISMMNYNQKELNKIIYVKTIKSVIDSLNETVNDNLCYVYPKDTTLNIANIMKSYFNLLKNEILYELKEQNENKILFIIAVPHYWNEFQKQLIIKSLKDSGITNTKMIYESESASLCISDDKYIEDKYKSKNNIFLLIDTGGSKTSITLKKFEDKKGNIKSILNFEKYDFGSNYIIEEIINVFMKLIVENKINNIKIDNPGAWVKFLKDVKVAVESTHNLKGIESFELSNIFNTVGTYKYEYKNFIYNIKFYKYDIIIPSDLIGNIILESFNKFKEYLDEIIYIIKKNNFNLNSFIITGGFGQNKIFKNEMNNYGENINIPVQYMSSFQYVVSKGCVIYGIQPEKILPRKSNINIGMYNFIYNKMDLLINKGDEIKNEITIVKYIKAQKENQDLIQIFIYLTDKDINETNELKEYLFGRLLIKNVRNIENIILNIKYDTHLDFFAIDYNNGKKIETSFEFFLQNEIQKNELVPDF